MRFSSVRFRPSSPVPDRYRAAKQVMAHVAFEHHDRPEKPGTALPTLAFETRTYFRGSSVIARNPGSTALMTSFSPPKTAVESGPEFGGMASAAPLPLAFATGFFGELFATITPPSLSPALPPTFPTASAWRHNPGPYCHLPMPTRKSLPRSPAPATSRALPWRLPA